MATLALPSSSSSLAVLASLTELTAFRTVESSAVALSLHVPLPEPSPDNINRQKMIKLNCDNVEHVHIEVNVEEH